MAQADARGLDAFARPVAYADEHSRADFLKRVATHTLGGLTLAAVSAVAMIALIYMVPILTQRWVMLGVMFGSMFVAQKVAGGMVFGEAKLPGLALGAAAEGVALAYVLLAAAAVGADVYGPEGMFNLILQAGGLTGLTVLSMVAYLWSAPKNLSMIGSAMAVLSVPMLVLMVVSFIFPIGGVFGLLLSVLFVGVSGAGLLYNLNQVLHTLRVDQHVEGAYTITIGVLVLFWNILVLLMRLSNRD